MTGSVTGSVAGGEEATDGLDGYDPVAWIYEARAHANPAARPTWDYYTALALSPSAPPGRLLELGVGTGRIAVAVARGGRPVLGLDLSAAMLTLCHRKAQTQNAASRLALIRADVRALPFPEARFGLITFPFRGIGHLLTDDDRRRLFAEVYRVLRPGGCFVFDHYVFDPRWAAAVEHRPQAAGFVLTPRGPARITDTFTFDHARQRLRCDIEVRTVLGEPLGRSALSFSWSSPEALEGLIARSGLGIDGIYGDYDHGPLTPHATQQLWHLRK